MRKPWFKLVFGFLCFGWIALKIDGLLDDSYVMTTAKRNFTYVGIVAFAVLGVTNLKDYWNIRKMKKTK